MKKAIIAMALALLASTAQASIVGSSHDLTANATFGGTGSRCQYCHLPHNAPVAGTIAPLWARNMNTTQTYTMYSSTFGGTAATADTAGNGSRLCLSCHDGTQTTATVYNISTGAFAPITGAANNTMKAPGGGTGASAAFQGTNLSSDHPIGVTYLTTKAGLGTPATTYANGINGNKAIVNGMLECTGCHNAHNATGVAGGYLARHFMANTGGTDFCAACHANQ